MGANTHVECPAMRCPGGLPSDLVPETLSQRCLMPEALSQRCLIPECPSQRCLIPRFSPCNALCLRSVPSPTRLAALPARRTPHDAASLMQDYTTTRRPTQHDAQHNTTPNTTRRPTQHDAQHSTTPNTPRSTERNTRSATHVCRQPAIL